jgi:hypothetical protein
MMIIIVIMGHGCIWGAEERVGSMAGQQGKRKDTEG